MPWKESRAMDEKVKFIADVLRAERSFSDLCKVHDISRKTGYKWIERFQEAGPSGLENMSRRPQACSHATSDAIVKQVLELRFKHPTWGARKLLARLETIRPETEWPAASTSGEILRRAGLVQRAKKKRRVTPSADPLEDVTKPNQLWCMDFKGHFRCGDGKRCDPLTITDAHTRYVIRCQAVNKTDFVHVDAVCDAAMREYGLPQRIRTDNGPPLPASACWDSAGFPSSGFISALCMNGLSPDSRSRTAVTNECIERSKRIRPHRRLLPSRSSRIVSMVSGTPSMKSARMRRSA